MHVYEIRTAVGRTKQYDEEQVLRKALKVFWAGGYKNTSVRTLEKEMGINQFSIYASFKSKRELFKLVLGYYEKEIEARFLGGLVKVDSSIRDIRKFMSGFALAIYHQQIPAACLMVKTSSELGKKDKEIARIITLFFDKMKILFTRALLNSQAQGEIGQELNIRDSAEYLVGVSQSLSVYSRLKSQKEIKKYIQFSLDRLS